MLRYVDRRQVRAGDRVVMARPDKHNNVPKGMEGTVDIVDSDKVGVIFDGEFKGHDFRECGSLPPLDQHGWFCLPQDLDYIGVKQEFSVLDFDIIIDALHTLLFSFEEGKRIDEYDVDEAWFGKVREVLAKLEGESCK